MKASLLDLTKLTYRMDVRDSDVEKVREIVESTSFFKAEEIEVAVELVEERLQKSIASGYYFIFGEYDDEVVGYACFGPIPATVSSYDLYWIAVRDDFRGEGIGKQLLQRAEKLISEMGGTRVYIETSSKDQYQPTRAFYEKNNYVEEALLKDFYANGDGKVVGVKVL